MLKGSGRKGQECAHSALKNHPLGFIGRGMILAQSLWPGMETRLRRATGQLEGFSTEAVDADGRYQGRDGIIRKAILNSGRFGRDGLTVEGTRENVALETQTFNVASWNKFNGMVVTTDDATGPDGETTADKLADTSATLASIIRDTFTITPAGSTVTTSVWVLKDAVTSRFPSIQFETSGGTGFAVWTDLNTSTGATNVRAAGPIGAVSNAESDGDFWYWISTYTDNDSGNNAVRDAIYPAYAATLGGANDNSLTGDITAFGIQTELGPFPSTYIENTTVATTRSAEDLRLDNTSEVICKATQGSIVFIAIPGFDGDQIAGGDVIAYDIRNAGNTDGFRIYYRKTDGDLAVEVKSDSVGVANLMGGGVGSVRGKKNIVAFAWDTDDFRLYDKAVLLDSDSLGAVPLTVNVEFFVAQDMANGRQMFGQLGCAVITEPSLTARQVENATAVMGKAA